jgi:hypothetical protein
MYIRFHEDKLLSHYPTTKLQDGIIEEYVPDGGEMLISIANNLDINNPQLLE